MSLFLQPIAFAAAYIVGFIPALVSGQTVILIERVTSNKIRMSKVALIGAASSLIPFMPAIGSSVRIAELNSILLFIVIGSVSSMACYRLATMPRILRRIRPA
jgi:hypothetical protein